MKKLRGVAEIISFALLFTGLARPLPVSAAAEPAHATGTSTEYETAYGNAYGEESGDAFEDADGEKCRDAYEDVYGEKCRDAYEDADGEKCRDAYEDVYGDAEEDSEIRDHSAGFYTIPDTAITDLNQLTEENVQNLLLSFQSKYPDGMVWTNDDYYKSSYLKAAGFGCYAFALMLGEAVFGDLPLRVHEDWNAIKVGDLLRVDQDSHSVVVIGVDGDRITVAEGNWGKVVRWGRTLSRNRLINGQGDYIESFWPEAVVTGINIVSKKPVIQLAPEVRQLSQGSDISYSWSVYNAEGRMVYSTEEKINDPSFSWEPYAYGEYEFELFYCSADGSYESKAMHLSESVKVTYHEYIKGECQMPYAGEGGGYLIGFETYDNPNQSYRYEMLILDCTLLAQGLPAWTYTTGQCGVAEGNALWTIWQPQYGYYWTLFRLYDQNGKQIDEVCYGFENI